MRVLGSIQGGSARRSSRPSRHRNCIWMSGGSGASKASATHILPARLPKKPLRNLAFSHSLIAVKKLGKRGAPSRGANHKSPHAEARGAKRRASKHASAVGRWIGRVASFEARRRLAPQDEALRSAAPIP